MKNQLDRDRTVVGLLDSMQNVYSFLDDIQAFPEKIKSLEDVIRAILQQTFECALFIQEYTGCGFAGPNFSPYEPFCWTEILVCLHQRQH